MQKLPFFKHFEQQIGNYNTQIIVNLLDSKGPESQITKEYEKEIKECTSLSEYFMYYAFDFHHHCKNNQYQHVSILLNEMKHIISVMSYYHKQKSQYQKGVIRTNCLDCLDRTNLMQSMFAKSSLLTQLEDLGFDIGQFEVDHPLFDTLFKEAWANNGDYISVQYAGTDALKGDFTRTGKRNTKGMVKDGVNSLSRYVINRFKDHMRQIAMDVFLGKTLVGMSEDDKQGKLEQIWSNDQLAAIEHCSSTVALLGEEKGDGWILTSVNNMNVEQQRVFLITSKAYYRFKYNFKSSKVVRYKRVPLDNIRVMHYGPIEKKPSAYGLIFTSVDERDEVYRDMYQSEGFRTDFISLTGHELVSYITEIVRVCFMELNSNKAHALPELKEQDIVIRRNKVFSNLSKNNLLLDTRNSLNTEK